MKKNIIIIALAISILTPLSFASAATVSFDRASVNAFVGQTIQMTVSVDPQSVKNYTVKLALDYPADLLEVTSFTFANSWTQLSQPGYDLIDNSNGLLIKTAGYPGGFSSSTVFGTITFRALKSGQATVGLNSKTLVLDANNQNLLSSSPVLLANISEVVVAPQTSNTTTTNSGNSSSNSQVVTQQNADQSQEAEVQDQNSQENATASVAQSGLLASVVDSVRSSAGITVIVVLLLLAGGVIAYINREFLLKKLKQIKK